MCGKSKSGFTLIEILVVIGIIALMATIALPRLSTRKPKYEREAFVRNLNALSAFATQQAIMKNKTHKMLFDFTKRTIQVQEPTDKVDDKKEPIFGKIKGSYIQSSLEIPRQFDFKNFIVEGFDEMSRHVQGKTTEVWYFVYPSGRSQAVILNIVDVLDKSARNKVRQFSLVLNPFSALFKEYDSFQK